MPHDDASTRAQLTETALRCVEARDPVRGLRASEELNRSFPEYAYGWYLTSFQHRRSRRLTDAVRTADRALALDDQPKYRLHKARCLFEAGQPEATAAELDALAGSELYDDQLHAEFGGLLVLLGRHEAALAQYTRAVELAPRNAGHRFNEAAVRRYLGDLPGAEAGFDAAIALNPREYEAYNARSNLRRQTAERNHLDELEAGLARTTDPAGLVQLHYAAAKELEDLERHDESFAHLQAGAGIKRRHMRYDLATDLAIFDAIRSAYGRGFFAGRSDGCDELGPIFVIGLPRTGTTLVERILASHSRVQSLGELNTFAVELMRRVPRGRPSGSRTDFVFESRNVDFAALGRSYLDGVRVLRDGREFFVDKLPFNYLYAGLIHRALPKARIVSLERHPLDACFAMYKQLFRDAYPFSYDLEELARYYVAWRDLMAHWQRVMPGVIHTVSYERLVQDFDREAPALLAHCGLEWEAGCERFHENVAPSTTASATQVRQPLYATSIGRWRRVARQLGPARAVLEAAGVDTT